MINDKRRDYSIEREHRQKYKIFDGWMKGQEFDMDTLTAYSSKPRDFLTSCNADWDSLKDGDYHKLHDFYDLY